MITLIKAIKSKGKRPTQLRVAEYLTLTGKPGEITSAKRAEDSADSTARLIRKYCKDSGYSWTMIKKMAFEAS